MIEYSSTGYGRGDQRTVNIMITGKDWDFIQLIDDLQWASDDNERLAQLRNAIMDSAPLVDRPTSSSGAGDTAVCDLVGCQHRHWTTSQAGQHLGVDRSNVARTLARQVPAVKPMEQPAAVGRGWTRLYQECAVRAAQAQRVHEGRSRTKVVDC